LTSQDTSKSGSKLNSNVFFLGLATFLADISGGLVNVVLPLFLTSITSLFNVQINALK
jgi:hypothetical protein